MKVKNTSSRLHHVGSVSILPGEEKVIPDSFRNSINKNELVEVKSPTSAKSAAQNSVSAPAFTASDVTPDVSQ